MLLCRDDHKLVTRQSDVMVLLKFLVRLSSLTQDSRFCPPRKCTHTGIHTHVHTDMSTETCVYRFAHEQHAQVGHTNQDAYTCAYRPYLWTGTYAYTHVCQVNCVGDSHIQLFPVFAGGCRRLATHTPAPFLTIHLHMQTCTLLRTARIRMHIHQCTLPSMHASMHTHARTTKRPPARTQMDKRAHARIRKGDPYPDNWWHQDSDMCRTSWECVAQHLIAFMSGELPGELDVFAHAPETIDALMELYLQGRIAWYLTYNFIFNTILGQLVLAI